RDGFRELNSFLCELHRFFEGPLRNSDGHGADAESTPVEDLQRIDESLVLVPEESLLRDLTVRQDDLGCSDAADPELILDLSDRESGVPPFHDERDDPSVRYRWIRDSMDVTGPHDRTVVAEVIRSV